MTPEPSIGERAKKRKKNLKKQTQGSDITNRAHRRKSTCNYKETETNKHKQLDKQIPEKKNIIITKTGSQQNLVNIAKCIIVETELGASPG